MLHDRQEGLIIRCMYTSNTYLIFKHRAFMVLLTRPFSELLVLYYAALNTQPIYRVCSSYDHSEWLCESSVASVLRSSNGFSSAHLFVWPASVSAHWPRTWAAAVQFNT